MIDKINNILWQLSDTIMGARLDGYILRLNANALPPGNGKAEQEIVHQESKFETRVDCVTISQGMCIESKRQHKSGTK